MKTDAQYMQQALRLAQRGRYTTSPNPNVGCVLVGRGEIVGQGWHRRAGEAHAEVNALQRAGAKARGACAYVTLEPCPMCAGAILQARIGLLVYGAADPKAGAVSSLFNLLNDARLNHETQVVPNVLAEQCGSNICGHLSARSFHSF